MMITNELLKSEVAASKRQGKTTRFLRQFVLRVADASMRQVYGDNYSIRCLQASIAIQTILEDIGIRSHLLYGALCVSKATRGEHFDLGWAGFWDRDHHVWVAVEFFEFVDLTISQLHLHPAGPYDTDEPIPAIWWHPANTWPPIIKYLPDGVPDIQLSGEDEECLRALRASLPESKLHVMRTCESSDTLYEPILHGIDHLQELTEGGHPWLRKSLLVQEYDIPMPPWVEERERRLRAMYQDRISDGDAQG
jgi:hypothetical protein